MSQAKLNFDEESLKSTGDLYQLYDKLYRAMKAASEVDAPALPSSDEIFVLGSDGNPVIDANGNFVIDKAKQAQMNKAMSDYTAISMKNAAYMYASSTMSVMRGSNGSDGESSGGSDTTGFVYRGGDSMAGVLSALQGFSAGVQGNTIFEVSIDSSDKRWAITKGNLQVKESAEITGLLNLIEGAAFDGVKSIYLENDRLVIERQNLLFKGRTTIDGSILLGDINISSDGIFTGEFKHYHSGNANLATVDWTMKDASVAGVLSALGGFALGANNQQALFSEVITSSDSESVVQMVLNSDLRIINSYGIKFGEDYIVSVRNSNVVSFSAPGMILNLGDRSNDKPTNKISIQSDIWDYSNTSKLISKEGAGNFVNGLRAKCATSGPAVLETYYVDSDNLGVLFHKQIRLGASDGAGLYYDSSSNRLQFEIPHENGSLSWNTFISNATSWFANGTSQSATLNFDTDGSSFSFNKPIESEFFAAKSEKYHTRLIPNALFFDDGLFIEGVSGGIRYAGNGYFDGSVSSPKFASGFAGYGWAVKEEKTNGGFHATFDSITIRKKMRLYELEVQKISCTNGSLWVSDFCSGDEVVAL